MPTRRSLLASVAASFVPRSLLARPKPIPDAAQQSRLLAYFKSTCPQLLREPQGILSHPSIASSLPRNQYATDLWDWDTLWTTRGLFRLAALTYDTSFHDRIALHAQGSLRIFLDQQAPDGRIPMLITVKDADPLGCLAPAAQPNSHNQAKPILGQLALLVADELKAVAWLEPYFPKLLHFYDSWLSNNQTPSGLLVWGNDVAIGNDNDPTTFGRPDFSSANLLLNCLFYEDLRAAAELAQRLARPADATRLTGLATTLAAAIQKHCWDPRDRFFYTADVQVHDRRAELIPNIKRGMDTSWQTLPLRIQVFTGFLPIWCGLATPAQAADLVHNHLLNPRTFACTAGVRSLSAQETMYSLAFTSNPSNWLGPVWIIVNYFAWSGLIRYGFRAEARELAARTIHTLTTDLAANGSLNEYYHPDTAVPLSHKGFMDWNLLVLEMMTA